MSDQPLLFQVRDERKPGHCWADNEIVDVYGPLIGAYGVAVYMVISRHSSNKTGKCTRPVGDIARQLAVSHDTVHRAIQKLVEHGLAMKEDGYLGRPCTYVLLAVPKERIVPVGQSDLPLKGQNPGASDESQVTLIASGGAKKPASVNGERAAKEVTLIASAISTDVTPTASAGKNDLPLTAATLTPIASGVPPTACRNKEEKLQDLTRPIKTRPCDGQGPPPDPRHKPIELYFKKCHASTNRMPESLVPWDGREGKALAKLLDDKPQLTVEQAERCIVNFYRSDKDFQQRPARTIPLLLEFWCEEKNQFGTARSSDKEFQREQSRRAEATLGTWRPS